MKELKFRVWGKTEKQYIRYPFAWLSIFDNPDGWEIEDNEDLVIEQYTGLKDKNGKEIYEGDIVEYDWYIIGDKPAYRVNSVVEFDYKGAMAGNNRLWKCTNVEVVGNIHENKELLNGHKED